MSIRWRMIVAYLLIVCVAFFLIATSLIRLVGEYMVMQKVRAEKLIADGAARKISDAWVRCDADTLYALSLQVAQENDCRVLALDLNGVVQADSASEYNGQYLAFAYNQVASVLRDESTAYGLYGIDDSTIFSRIGLYFGNAKDSIIGLYASPIMNREDLSGVLLLLTYSNDVIESLALIQRQILTWIILVTVAVSIIIVILVTRMVNRPIDDLRAGIGRMARGDLGSRVEVRGRDEFTELALAFNTMSEQLETLDHARNQFVSNASHELKTPLSTMKILIENLLYQDGSNPDMQKEFLQDVDREIDRLNAVINDLLTLVRVDGGEMKLHPTNVRLDNIVRDTVKRIAPQAEIARIRLECVINDTIEMRADAMKIQQLIFNLLDNAIKYTLPDGAVKAELARSGRKAIIRISDTGIGVPKSDQIHIFDRFYRVDKARARDTGGTGLGLSIVRQNVLLHNGTISLLSEEGVGTTFTVELPIE